MNRIVLVIVLISITFAYNIDYDNSAVYEFRLGGVGDRFSGYYTLSMRVNIRIPPENVLNIEQETIRVCPNSQLTITVSPSVSVSNVQAEKSSNVNEAPSVGQCQINPSSYLSNNDVIINNFCGRFTYGKAGTTPPIENMAMNGIVRIRAIQVNVFNQQRNSEGLSPFTTTINVNSDLNLNGQISYSIKRIGGRIEVASDTTYQSSWCMTTDIGCYKTSDSVIFSRNVRFIPVDQGQLNNLININVNPVSINTNGSGSLQLTITNIGSKAITIIDVSSNLPGVSVVSGLNQNIPSGQNGQLVISFSNSCQSQNNGQITIKYRSSEPICGQNIEKSVNLPVTCSAPTLPDLTPSGQNNSYSSGTLGVTLNVSNTGSGSASNIVANVRNNKTNTWQSFNYPGTLGPNQIWSIPYSVQCNPGERVRIEIVVDPNNGIVESNENNNNQIYDLICGVDLCELTPPSASIQRVQGATAQTQIRCGSLLCSSISVVNLPSNYLLFQNNNPTLIFTLQSPNAAPNQINLDIRATANNNQYECRFRIDISRSDSMDDCRKRI